MNNVTFINNALRHLGESGGPTHKWYGMGGNWCDMYVTKCFYETDKSLWFGKQSYCPTTINILRAHWAEVPMYLAMPGDVIFFDWDRNGRPNHIGLVLQRVSTSKIGTLEGNTGSPAKVRKRKRNSNYPIWIFRPHFKPKSTQKKGELDPDGDFGFRSIYMLQVVLGLTPTGILTKQTVIALQKAVGATPDGAWGKDRAKKSQSKRPRQRRRSLQRKRQQQRRRRRLNCAWEECAAGQPKRRSQGNTNTRSGQAKRALTCARSAILDPETDGTASVLVLRYGTTGANSNPSVIAE